VRVNPANARKPHKSAADGTTHPARPTKLSLSQNLFSSFDDFHPSC
jgi:hypothetical protein